MAGMVCMRGTEGTIRHAENAPVSVFACGVEASATEAKGTVLMKNADDLMNYNKSEEKKMDEIIKSIADTGTKVIISGGTVSEMAMHFIERYGMMCIRITSKWELRRLCTATGATALVRLGPATAEELGFCDEVDVKEIGGRKVTVFNQVKSAKDGCRISTILLRASTESVLNDLERAIDDGVNCIRTCCTNGDYVAGAGACETEVSTQKVYRSKSVWHFYFIFQLLNDTHTSDPHPTLTKPSTLQLSQRIKAYGDTRPGLDQYAIKAFAKALEFVPRTLAENSGQEATDVLAALGGTLASKCITMLRDGNNTDQNMLNLLTLTPPFCFGFSLPCLALPCLAFPRLASPPSAAHANGSARAGVDISGAGNGVMETADDLVDLFATKESAFRLAVDATLTVLRVDQIIMSKPAGGGKTMQ